MHWYPHDIKAFGFAAKNLDFRERGIYRELLDWYYTHERPLPPSPIDVFKAIGAKSQADQDAAERILAEFFIWAADGYHQTRADEVLGRYRAGLGVTPRVTRDADANAPVTVGARRQARYRVTKETLLTILKEAGKSVPAKAGNTVLKRMCEEFGLNLDGKLVRVEASQMGVMSAVTKGVTRNVTVTEELKNIDITPSGLPSVVMSPGARVGEALRTLRAVGFTANGSDPTLLGLLAENPTEPELRVIGAEAAAKGKGMAWLAATLRGRRADAARPVKTFKQKADEEHLRRWAPELIRQEQKP